MFINGLLALRFILNPERFLKINPENACTERINIYSYTHTYIIKFFNFLRYLNSEVYKLNQDCLEAA